MQFSRRWLGAGQGEQDLSRSALALTRRPFRLGQLGGRRTANRHQQDQVCGSVRVPNLLPEGSARVPSRRRAMKRPRTAKKVAADQVLRSLPERHGVRMPPQHEIAPQGSVTSKTSPQRLVTVPWQEAKWNRTRGERPQSQEGGLNPGRPPQQRMSQIQAQGARPVQGGHTDSCLLPTGYNGRII